MELILMGPLDLSEKKATICYLTGHYGLGLVEAGDVDQLMEFVEERRGSARSASPKKNKGEIMKSSSKHWDTIFSNTEDSKLGWYEKNASQTLKLLNQIPEWKRSTVFLPGAGTSVLIEKLLSKGVRLVLNDISIEALNRVKDRLNDKGGKIDWLCQDISQPIQRTLPEIGIWIDRAVLHFLTDEDDINGYFENVKSTLKTGGYAIFAEFSKTGAPKCAGLILHRYSIEELSEKLGSSFKLISHFEYTYFNPPGDTRPYVYALYKKENKKHG